jgi:hypothetical protein
MYSVSTDINFNLKRSTLVVTSLRFKIKQDGGWHALVPNILKIEIVNCLKEFEKQTTFLLPTCSKHHVYLFIRMRRICQPTWRPKNECHTCLDYFIVG